MSLASLYREQRRGVQSATAISLRGEEGRQRETEAKGQEYEVQECSSWAEGRVEGVCRFVRGDIALSSLFMQTRRQQDIIMQIKAKEELVSVATIAHCDNMAAIAHCDNMTAVLSLFLYCSWTSQARRTLRTWSHSSQGTESQ